MIKVRIKKQLKEISKREQRLKDRGIDPDLVTIPRSMKRLASGIIGEDELTEKEKKLNCQPGNARHRSDGKFGSKDDNTSWSLSKPSGATDCTAGQSRMDKGSNKRKITKKDPKTKYCGRDHPKGTSKSKYKCKGGAVWQEGDDEKWPGTIKVRIRKKDTREGVRAQPPSMILATPPQWINEDVEAKLSRIEDEETAIDQDEDLTIDPAIDPEETSAFDQAMSQRDKLINALAKLSAKERMDILKDPCNMTGLYSIDKAAQMVNKYSLALKGKMNDEPKK